MQYLILEQDVDTGEAVDIVDTENGLEQAEHTCAMLTALNTDKSVKYNYKENINNLSETKFKK